jgi:hypothetical protein
MKKKNSSKSHKNKKTKIEGVVGANRVEGESGVHLRTETTRSSSSIENACVISIEPFG